MESARPTVTSIRVKSLLTGTISQIFSLTDNFRSSEVEEDNVLEHVIRSGRTVGFAGDYIWEDMFSRYFNESYPQPSLNVRDLDSLDIAAFQDLFYMMGKKKQHDLLIGHVLGVDHAGHTYGSNNKHLERKLLETEEKIKEIISKMKPGSTLIVFGDHGMTSGGNHGGGSDYELSSILFAYRKEEKFPGHFSNEHLR